MKKYLALAAMLFASNACAMEPSTEIPATEQTQNVSPLDQVTNEIVTALKAQGSSETDILSFVMALKRFKDAGLTDRQIMQRLEAFTGKGSIRTTRRNNRQLKIVAALAALSIAAVVAVAWYLINKKNTTIAGLQPNAETLNALVADIKAHKDGQLATQAIVTINAIADKTAATRSADENIIFRLYNLLNDNAAFEPTAADKLADGKMQHLKVKGAAPAAV